jgi:hypothetical protein
MNRQVFVAFIFAGFVAGFMLTAGDAIAGGKPDGSKCHVHKSCRSGSCIRQTPTDKFGTCCAPQDCPSLGAQCGEIDNGCGTPIQCGDCGPGETCVSNQCQAGSTTTSTTSTTTTSTSTTSTTNSTTTTVPVCPGLTCPFDLCNEGLNCYSMQSSDACGVCVHNFFCGDPPACTSADDCDPGQVCVIDSCCGPGTGYCSDLCDATTTTTTLGATTTTLGPTTTTTLGATTTTVDTPTTTLGATTTTLAPTTTTMGATTSTTLDPCENGTQDGDETGTDCGGSCGATCGFGAGCIDNTDCASDLCDEDVCRDHLVFVTSQSYTGSLGGLAGADTKCNTLAGAAGLGGTWVAWLSATGTNAISRIVDQQYRNMSGEVAFTSKFLMSLTGAASVAINYNENGDSTGSDLAWTGSNASGLAQPNNCSEWTSTSGTANTGRPSVNNEWSLSGVTQSACSDSLRLICFEN